MIGQASAPGWSFRITPKPGAEFQSALAAAAAKVFSSGCTVLPSRLTIAAWVILFCLA